MDVNVFIREIVVHDTRDMGGSAGEYDLTFAASSTGTGTVDGASGALHTSPHWTNSVKRGESYEVLEWLGPVSVADGGTLVVSAHGQERDLIGNDPLLGGIAHLTATQELGVGRWWRTTNGKHFDFLFAVARASDGHAGRPPLTGRAGEIGDAPGPDEPSPDDYPARAG